MTDEAEQRMITCVRAMVSVEPLSTVSRAVSITPAHDPTFFFIKLSNWPSLLPRS